MSRTASAAFTSVHGLTLLAALCFGATALAQTAATTGPAAMPPAFHEVDADKSGRVTVEEVMAYARRKKEETRPFALKDVDRDGDGLVTQEELARAGIHGLEGFGTIKASDLDRNGDGYVNHKDLEDYLNQKHRDAYLQADTDGDGSLRQSEFVLFRFK